jgi:hypothetical protein
MRTVRSTTANIDVEESAAPQGRAAQQRRAQADASLMVSSPDLHLHGSFAGSTPPMMDQDI